MILLSIECRHRLKIAHLYRLKFYYENRLKIIDFKVVNFNLLVNRIPAKKPPSSQISTGADTREIFNLPGDCRTNGWRLLVVQSLKIRSDCLEGVG